MADGDMPGLLPATWTPPQQQAPQQPQQQAHNVPFPSLLPQQGAMGPPPQQQQQQYQQQPQQQQQQAPPQQWQQQQSQHSQQQQPQQQAHFLPQAPFPSTLPTASGSSATSPPRTATHVAVPAHLVAGFGTLHGAQQPGGHGHSHGPPASAPQQNGAAAHVHSAPYAADPAYQAPSQSPPQAHAHSHGGQPCHGHGAPQAQASAHGHSHSGGGGDHGHSHSGGGGDHGHSHDGGGDHGHSHDGGEHGHSHAPARSLKQWEEPVKASGPLVARVRNWLHMAWRGGGDSRHVLLYIGLKLGFLLVQLLWGGLGANLGLVTASFHTAFDVLALCFALHAMLRAKYPPRHPYSYGFDRGEVVAAFTHTVFLLFVATFLLMETFHHALETPDVEWDELGLAALGAGMDLAGLALFGRYARAVAPAEDLSVAALSASPSGGAASSGWSKASPLLLGANGLRGHLENMHGIALHVVANLLGHSTLLAATWLHALYPGFGAAYALLSLGSSVLVMRLVLPLFQHTGGMLLLTTPSHVRLGLDRGIREISFFDGVLELRRAHWWTHTPGVVVGSLHLRIRADASEQHILAYVHSMLRKYCAVLTVQIEKDHMPTSWVMHNTQVAH